MFNSYYSLLSSYLTFPSTLISQSHLTHTISCADFNMPILHISKQAQKGRAHLQVSHLTKYSAGAGDQAQSDSCSGFRPLLTWQLHQCAPSPTIHQVPALPPHRASQDCSGTLPWLGLSVAQLNAACQADSAGLWESWRATAGIASHLCSESAWHRVGHPCQPQWRLAVGLKPQRRSSWPW